MFVDVVPITNNASTPITRILLWFKLFQMAIDGTELMGFWDLTDQIHHYWIYIYSGMRPKSLNSHKKLSSSVNWCGCQPQIDPYCDVSRKQMQCHIYLADTVLTWTQWFLFLTWISFTRSTDQPLHPFINCGIKLLIQSQISVAQLWIGSIFRSLI